LNAKPLSKDTTMTHELGRLEDLPADYVQDLRDLNLVPLWPNTTHALALQNPEALVAESG
jgi:hypothetical protein